MIHDVEINVKKIIGNLNTNYEQFESLKTRLKTTSLLKVYSTEKRSFFSLFSSKKFLNKHEKIMPNKTLISWYETMVLEIHEDFQRALDLSKKLKEFSPILFKQISLLIDHCFNLHLDLRFLGKNNYEYFHEKLQPSKPLTLHQIESFIEDQFLDIMIVLQQTLGESKEYCKQLSFYVENKV